MKYDLNTTVEMYIKKMYKWRACSEHRSSALLLSFFMMGMLILVSLGVSYLVLQDLAAMRTVVGGVQASYAAEGMTEIGLHMVKENLPGYETEIETSEDYFDVTLSSLDLDALSSIIPCENQSEEEWMRLSKNESIQLPLFYQVKTGNDEVQEVEDFVVNFYVGDAEGNAFEGKLEVDVLRWKIIGFIDGGTRTEAISEFIPVHASELVTHVGTWNVSDYQYRQGKYTSNGGFTANMEISSFLFNHEYNYIVLTNVFESSSHYIYYQLESPQEDLACPYVEVNGLASNEYGESRQSLTTFMREGENLPAYDFVLYNTDNDGEEEESSPLSSSNLTLPSGVLEALGLTPSISIE